jgi:vacuolar-type H+-ATPase subunit H
MARPREQAGGLAEASRLLQEGLQLLAEREREVNQLLEDARERALVIREEAERRAAQIIAEAEQRHTEVEELVAGLRSEVESLRAELADLRASSQQSADGDAADEPDAPRWGRPSTAVGGQQAVRTGKSSKPRWLPPWR